MNSKLHHLLTAILIAGLFGSSIPASANKPKGLTSAEMALLPRFCPDVQGFKYGDASYNTSPNAAKWVSMMGKTFWHMHHHCWAVANFHRSHRPNVSAAKRQALLEEALVDFIYVVERAPDDFVLLPEVLTWVGRTELLLKRPHSAEPAFAKARALKPNYWPPYFHWAEHLKKVGRNDEAIEMVKNGLQHAPGTKALLLLYRDLGGKPGNIPAPVSKGITSTAEASAPNNSSASAISPAPGPKKQP
jgi:tetratricopeptide (TPR) repeat protein